MLYGRHTMKASSPDIDQYLADIDAANTVAGSSMITGEAAIVKMENVKKEGQKSYESDTQAVSDDSQDSDDQDETDRNEAMQMDE
jgi:hypothetical protein